MRKARFFVGLNLWGLGLAFAVNAIGHSNGIAWLIPSLLLLVGSMLLTSALFPHGE